MIECVEKQTKIYVIYPQVSFKKGWKPASMVFSYNVFLSMFPKCGILGSIETRNL